MPYSGPDDPDLPANVKKLSTKKKKKWIATFESVLHTPGKSESDAFAIANGTIKEKALVPSVYDVDERQLMPEQVNYNPLGMTSEKGCAGCNWYVPPNACILVYADIMPTGVCDLFMKPPVYEPVPIPVTVVKGDEPFLSKMISAIKVWAKGGEKDTEPVVETKEESAQISTEEVAAPPENPIAPAEAQAPVHSNNSLYFYKGGDGRVRFFTVYSNHFQDKQKETIDSVAHKDFVNWVEETGNYPELWLWHSGPLSKWGKADFVDYVDGFALASGLVDEGKEYIAEALSKQDIGVSHGMKALVNNGHIIRYRTFEISPLPSDNAANSITGAVFSKEIGMPFTEKKKTWLKEVAKLSDEDIATWEGNLAKLDTQLKALGIEWKEVDVDDVTGQIASLTKAVTDVANVIVPLVETVKKLSTDMDTKVASVFQAEIAKLPQGFKASESPANVVPDAQVKKDMAWFGEAISKGVVK